MNVKIVVVDSYQSNPLRNYEATTCPATGKSVNKVPVIRVFGISESGQKCCIHVHNAFPYLLIPRRTDDDNFPRELAESLETKLSEFTKTASVYDVQVVSAYPIYGYHAGEENFVKILLLNPAFAKKASELLLSGKVMSERFQPHEAHIPYHLQFLVNHNLFGMDWMSIKSARFREGSWCTDIDKNDSNFSIGQLQRSSCCSVECDISATDIENQYRSFGEASVSSLSALWEDERLRRLNHGLSVDDLKLPTSPDGRQLKVSERDKTLGKRFADIVASAKSLVQKTTQVAPPQHYDSGLTQVLAGIVGSAQAAANSRGASFGQSFDTDFTQLLAGIVDNAERELSHQSNSVGRMDRDHLSDVNCSLTQVLEGIVHDAETARNLETSQPESNLVDEEIEPGSMLHHITQKFDNYGNEESVNNEENDDVEDDFQGVDWNAFLNDDDNPDQVSSSQIPPQLDGTHDKSGSKRPTPQSSSSRSPPRKNRRSIQFSENAPSTSAEQQCGETSQHVIDIRSSSSSSSSVVISGFEPSGRYNDGCPIGVGRPECLSPEIEFPDTLAKIIPNSPLSEVTSSIYSFQGSSAYQLTSGDSPMLPSPSASPASDLSIKIVGISQSQAASSATPKVFDQTSIQFFHDDLTPFPTANETELNATDHGKLKPKRKPPSRGIVDRWLRKNGGKPKLNNDTMMIEATGIDESHVGPSCKLPALTSTPHPSRFRLKLQTPVSTMMMDTTVISSPICRSQTPFSFAVKSMKNPSPMGDKQHKFAAQHLTVVSVEVHAVSATVPDPSRDPIAFLVLSKMSCLDVSFNNEIETILLVAKNLMGEFPEITFLPSCTAVGPVTTRFLEDEHSVIVNFLEELDHYDPDILCGYEVERASLGYITKRASALQMVNIVPRLGRIIPLSNTAAQPSSSPENKEFSFMSAKGRVIFSVWRLVRHELEHVHSYSFESSAFHVLHRRMPKFDNGLLTWWLRKSATRTRTFLYYIERAIANIKMLIQLNLLSRTSELARLYGILYYDCLSRGSQYRVEAVMLRLAKRLNFIAVSPSMQQRAAQCAPECIALNLEPISNYYKSPVIVLDFQSLYPSIMIAYNYSFDTCLGKLERLAKGGPQQLGCFVDGYEIPPEVLASMSEDDVNISPNGVVFVKRHIRRGVLPAVVEDLLNSRLMVKASMKLYKEDPAICKLLDERQFGLKLLANVTYGYTAANFSGRMPCIEVADAIVRKGREALENAITMVHSRRNEWLGARVIYGDTDSLFVLLPGASMKDAFDVGAKIADAVTMANPSPIKLKLEKVFSRCILEAKKRYCGFMYETPDQKEPEFLSKGLETMRIDQCPFVASVLEKSIRTLFTTDNQDQVLRYLRKEIKRLEAGTVPIPDLILSREYRGAERYSEKGSAAAMLIANRRRAVNPLTEPLTGERVHYLITVDAPGMGIMQTAREPVDFVTNGLRANVDYYVRRQLLPALDRALGTAGIDVFKLISGLQIAAPGNIAENNRVRMPTYSKVVAASSSKVITLTQLYTKRQCVICGTQTTAAQSGGGFFNRRNRLGARFGTFDKICINCRAQPTATCAILGGRAAALERKVEALAIQCQSCCRFQPFVQAADIHTVTGGENREIFSCSSTDCPSFYEQYNRHSLLSAAREFRNILGNFDTARFRSNINDV